VLDLPELMNDMSVSTSGIIPAAYADEPLLLSNADLFHYFFIELVE